MSFRSLHTREAASASSRHEPGLLQDFRITELRSEAFEVARQGVTPGTGCLEIRFTGFGVTHENAWRLLTRDIVAANFEAVNIGCDIRNSGVGQIELRHSLVHAPV